VTGMDDLIAYLARSTKVGQQVTLTILRNGKQQSVDVTLAARPSAAERGTANTVTRGITLGIQGMTVNDSVAKAMNLPSGQSGVLVTQVQSGSLADTAGLRSGTQTVTINGQQVNVGGDIITALNGQPITNIQELKAGLGQLTTDQNLELTILRDGVEIQITVQPGQ